jgi:alanyl-tRNA synthetase
VQAVDDLNEKIRVEELKNERQFQSMRDQHQQYREMLLSATIENTQLLESIADLSQKQFKLEKELNSTGSQMHVADQGPLIKNEIEERNRLVQLVKLQAKEVDALKAEINMLRRKGGHVSLEQSLFVSTPTNLHPFPLHFRFTHQLATHDSQRHD